MILSFLSFGVGLGAAAQNVHFHPLMQQLVKDGFQENQLNAIFNGDQPVELALESVALFFSHRESRLNYDQFLTKSELEKARTYMSDHADILSKVEKEYGVKKSIITAITLVETRLGTYLGRSPVLEIFATLAAIESPELKEMVWNKIPPGRRIDRETFEIKVSTKSKWAYKELQAYLTYSLREGIIPSSIKGSYAGAIGISQFMPTSIISYGKDGDNDGKIDLFNHEDAITSIANYLKQFGWHPGISEPEASKVLFNYNRSQYYVDTLLKISKELES